MPCSDVSYKLLSLELPFLPVCGQGTAEFQDLTDEILHCSLTPLNLVLL